MKPLQGYQKKYLRGLAHSLKPVVLIGQKGVTDALAEAVSDALDQHELIKVKFLDFKESEQKQEIVGMLEEMTGCQAAGLIGHMAILFRQHRDPEKRKIRVPDRQETI